MTSTQQDISLSSQSQPNILTIDTSQFGPITLVIIQPTSFCNLDCDYCYLPDRHLHNRLSLDLIDPIIKSIFSSPFVGADFCICWHAGEPLTMPLSFYKEAFEKINESAEKYNQTDFSFHHSFQTNGTLINQAWCDLFKQYPVHVGVSIDGPDFLHDAHRKNRKGGGSHALTMRGIRYLQENDILYSAIAVITEESLNYPDEIFNFFMDNGITEVGFNMEETEGVNQASSLNGATIEQRYQAFIQRIWELAKQSQGVFQLREFELLGDLIYTEDRLKSTEMNLPFGIVNIDSQGNFSTFDPELLSVNTTLYGDFVLGNILVDSLESVCSTAKFQKMYQDLQNGVRDCQRTCDYFGLCGGGSGSNKYWENGTFDSTETQACRYRIKLLTDVVVEDLERSLGLE